ncbi:MAG: ABC transporter ATP-binding protein/permease [Lactobacillales bacterium]|nr:ABC transporter ATP-binding protein/permease [Lactobacillales bacterium]
MAEKYVVETKLKNSFIHNYKRMWPFVRPYWFRALISLIITIPIGGLDAIIALSLKPFMDTVLLEKGEQTPFDMPLYVIPIFIVVFTIFQSLLEYTSTYLNTWVGGKVTAGLKKKVFAKLVTTDASFIDNATSGSIVFKCETDPNSACSGLLNNLKTFTTRVFSSLSLIFVLFYTSWQLAIITIIVLGSSLYPLTRIRKRIKEVLKKTVLAGGQILTTLNETFSGHKTIASYNLQQYQRDKYETILQQIFKLAIKMTQKTAWLSPMMHVIISIGIAGTIWYGSYLIKTDAITPGDFVAFMTAMLMLYTPVKNIGKNFTSVQLSFMAIERVFDFLGQTEVIRDKKDAVEISGLHKSIAFKDVSFAYKPDVPVLKGISFDVKKGQQIALVGNSGGGKTTIVNLIPRFYEINSGSIQIDGTDVRDIKLHSLRDKIAVVFQDNFLFSGTLRENIMLGNEHADNTAVQKAIKSACLDEFIAGLKDGLDTQIGERGVLLSGGQKQRLSIARAFLKNAPIVVLDEATSALDNKSEAIVQQAIDNLMNDRTVFVIAHRLSTIQNADKIIVVNEGRIIEEGKHDELLAEGGAYYALYQAQFKTKG